MRRGWDFFAAGLCLAVFIFTSRREVQRGAGASVDTPKLATLGTEQNNLGSSENVTVVCLGDSHSKHAVSRSLRVTCCSTAEIFLCGDEGVTSSRSTSG